MAVLVKALRRAAKPMAKKRTAGFHPVKRKGALTRKAKRAGESVGAYARAHEHSPGLTGKQARFALIARKWKHTGPKKRARKRA